MRRINENWLNYGTIKSQNKRRENEYENYSDERFKTQ